MEASQEAYLGPGPKTVGLIAHVTLKSIDYLFHESLSVNKVSQFLTLDTAFLVDFVLSFFSLTAVKLFVQKKRTNITSSINALHTSFYNIKEELHIF